MKKDKIKIIKLIILIFFISIMIFLSFKMNSIFKNIATNEGRTNFQKEIEGLGYEGVLIIIGLVFAQVFLAILPGEPIELLAGMCYGPIGGMIVIFLGVFVSTFIIYYAVKKFGKDFVYSFISKEKIDKFENNKLLKDKRKVELVLFILFFIPGTPKDFLTYIGGLLPIKSLHFLLIATFARFPSVISSTFVGSNLIYGNWKIIILTYIITFSISGLIIYYIKKKEKSTC